MSRIEFIDVDASRLWTVGWDPGLSSWFASYEAWPPADRRDEPVDVCGVRPGEVPTVGGLLAVLDDHGVARPLEVDDALTLPGVLGGDLMVQFWSPEMVGAQPWHVGAESQRWEGYLDLEHYDTTYSQPIMRNVPGLHTYDALRWFEDVAVPVRAVQMREAGIPAAFDLEGLQAIHRYLFQDVYPWAGELRTVTITKGEGGFAEHDRIVEAFGEVTSRLEATDGLRSVAAAEVPRELAGLYNALNVAHPFREGNGRTQREFLTAVCRDAGIELDWTRAGRLVNIHASQQGALGNLAPLVSMFEAVVKRPPEPTLPGPSSAVRASFPTSAVSATDRDGDVPTERPRTSGYGSGMGRNSFGR